MSSSKNIHISYYENRNFVDDVDTIKKKQAKVLIESLHRAQFNYKQKARILDIGCGVGIIGKEFAKSIKATQIHGLDLSKSAVTLAKRYGVKAKLADIDETWPYKSNTFDIVLGVQIIEHVSNPDNFVKESFRVLRKGGTFILTTPNLAAWFNRIIFLFGYQPFFTEVSTVDKTIGLSFTRKMTPNRETVGHLHVFTYRALKEIVSMYGFEILTVKGNAVDYLPNFMKPFDSTISQIPSLSSDLLLIAKK